MQCIQSVDQEIAARTKWHESTAVSSGTSEVGAKEIDTQARPLARQRLSAGGGEALSCCHNSA